jgi:hypothetical protein
MVALRWVVSVGLGIVRTKMREKWKILLTAKAAEASCPAATG